MNNLRHTQEINNLNITNNTENNILNNGKNEEKNDKGKDDDDCEISQKVGVIAKQQVLKLFFQRAPKFVRVYQQNPLPLTYSIFQGKSELRNVLKLMMDNKKSHATNRDFESVLLLQVLNLLLNKPKLQNVAAIMSLLLLEGPLSVADIAHEIILGVNMTNINEAEYAATHPGQTTWSIDHPLSQSANYLHALIHRLEGALIGEGGHSGYDNAKYWFGQAYNKDKMNKEDENFTSRLTQYMIENCPGGGTVNQFVNGNYETIHKVISGGGKVEKTRNVHIYPGEWDPFALSDWIEKNQNITNKSQEEEYIFQLQLIELQFILHTELERLSKNQ